MAINRVSLTSQSITENTDAVIDLRYTAPPGTFEQLDPAEPPGKLIGYYDGTNNTVQLYVVDRSGLGLISI